MIPKQSYFYYSWLAKYCWENQLFISIAGCAKSIP